MRNYYFINNEFKKKSTLGKNKVFPKNVSMLTQLKGENILAI